MLVAGRSGELLGIGRGSEGRGGERSFTATAREGRGGVGGLVAIRKTRLAILGCIQPMQTTMLVLEFGEAETILQA